jgi:hypothetical protein
MAEMAPGGGLSGQLATDPPVSAKGGVARGTDRYDAVGRRSNAVQIGHGRRVIGPAGRGGGHLGQGLDLLTS